MKSNSKNLTFYLLALDLNKTKLYKISKDKTEEISLANIPTSLDKAIGKDEFEQQLQCHTSSGVSEKSGKKMFHGHGSGKDHHIDNISHFFRELDKDLNKIILDKDTPLLLAGVDYLLPIYEKVSKYPSLIDEKITGNPERIGIEELCKRSTQIITSYYLNKG